MIAVKSYIEKHNVPCEWRTVTGCRTFWTTELFEEAKAEVAKVAEADPELGKQITVITDKEDLAKHRVAPQCTGATLTKGAGSLWPYKYVTFILERHVQDGFLNLQTNTPVEKLESLKEEYYRTALHTSRGVLKARTVILATNGYTSALLPEFADLIVPMRGEMSALFPPENSTILPNSYGMVGFGGRNASLDDYLIQRPYEGVPNPAGHLMFGGGRARATLPSAHQWDDSVIDEGSAEYLRESLLKMLLLDGETHSVKELKASHQWTGIMGFSRDDHPWVGKVPDREGIYMSAGYTGHGMPNGSLCGKAVAEMIVAGEEEGKELEALLEQMVQDGDLPRGYVVSKKRIKEARELFTVEEADKRGYIGRYDGLPKLV
jgi:glycine/D-amino acid oxidase-like deaminating enzyme